MVSIVLSTYNSLKYIEAQLESLKSQTYKYFDVIITDDGSTDGTIDYLKSYIASNGLDKWKLYENKENVGYALNFKRGIEKAEGDIIFLCDHDDIWHSNKIEEMVRIFNKKKKASLIGTSFNFIDGDSKPINNDGGLVSLLTSNHKLIKYHIGHNKLKRLSYKQIYTYSFTPGCCMAFRKEIKEEVVKRINVAPHDYILSLYAANIKGAYFYNKAFIDYRIHSNNQIGIKDKNDISERIKVAKKDYADKLDMYEHLKDVITKKNEAFTLKHLDIIERRIKALEAKDKKAIKKILLKSFFMKRYFYTILKDKKCL